MENDLDAAPVGVDGVEAGEVVDGVEAALVLVEALEANVVAEDREELVEPLAENNIVVKPEFSITLSAFKFGRNKVDHQNMTNKMGSRLIKIYFIDRTAIIKFTFTQPHSKVEQGKYK